MAPNTGLDVSYRGIAADTTNIYLVSEDGKAVIKFPIPSTKNNPVPQWSYLGNGTKHSIKGGAINGPFCLTNVPPKGFWCESDRDAPDNITRLIWKGNSLEVQGSIFPPAEKTWGLAHDGRYLYLQTRTHEIRRDAKIFIVDTSLEALRRSPPFLGTDPGLLKKTALQAPEPFRHDGGHPILPAISEYGLERSELLSSETGGNERIDMGGLSTNEAIVEDLGSTEIITPTENPDYSTQVEVLSAADDGDLEEQGVFSSGADLGEILTSSKFIITDDERERGISADEISISPVQATTYTPEEMNEARIGSVKIDGN